RRRRLRPRPALGRARHLLGAGAPADPVALARGRARRPAAVGGGGRGDEDALPLHLGHVRALPGDDRPVPDDRLVPGGAPRRGVLRPLLPAGGSAAARALAHARLAPADLTFELGGTLPAARLASPAHRA